MLEMQKTLGAQGIRFQNKVHGKLHQFLTNQSL